MEDKVKIAPGFYMMGALAVLLLPLRWVIGMVLAVLVHELFHCIAVFFTGGRVMSLSLGVFGARIETTPMTAGREVICALAGPFGSFSLLLAAEHWPETALCGLIQGGYNLLPLYPLDGGRAVKCLLPEEVCFGIGVFAVVFLSGIGLWVLTYNAQLGVILLLSLWLPVVQRKIACKAGGLAVQ